MPPKLNLSNRKFAKLTAIHDAGCTKQGKRLWFCVCDCGKYLTTVGAALVSGNTTSCGCALGTHHQSYSSEYGIWKGMIQRCTNSKSRAFKWYGGRGITITKQWLKFENFLSDMGPRPPNLTLDRINNSKGYFPSNCRWASRREQSSNTRRNRYVEFQGEKITFAELSRRTGIHRRTLAGRILSRGMTLEEAIK